MMNIMCTPHTGMRWQLLVKSFKMGKSLIIMSYLAKVKTTSK